MGAASELSEFDATPASIFFIGPKSGQHQQTDQVVNSLFKMLGSRAGRL
jgi:hypothetical protein